MTTRKSDWLSPLIGLLGLVGFVSAGVCLFRGEFEGALVLALLTLLLPIAYPHPQKEN